MWFAEGHDERSHLFDDRGRSLHLHDLHDDSGLVAFSPDHCFVWAEDTHGDPDFFQDSRSRRTMMRSRFVSAAAWTR